MTKFSWTPENVSSTKTAQRSIRTYIEQYQLRELLHHAELSSDRQMVEPVIAEFGCGFGRLLPVALEFSSRVWGFEREESLAELASKLTQASIVNVVNLWDFPTRMGIKDEVDISYVFTVLQHMTDKDAKKVLDTMLAITKDDGFIIVGEDTDPRYHYVDKNDPKHFTNGRSVAWYREALKPMKLWTIRPRLVEPGYKSRGAPRSIVGHWMLFTRIPE